MKSSTKYSIPGASSVHVFAALLASVIFVGASAQQAHGQSTDEATAAAQVDEAVAKLKAQISSMDYQAAQYHPLHFPPAIERADDRECLVCHQEVIDRKPLAKSPAGVDSTSVLAWYQTLDTYEGEQLTFHQRHLTSPFSQSVMDLSCNFCHQGNDPREEHPDMMQSAEATNTTSPPFALRKMVNPSETCLLCHGAMPDPVKIMTMPGPWPEVQKIFESVEGTNGCFACHGAAFRTERHQVTYLKADGIEEAAKTNSDVCYGCHGGRAWFNIAYPYPRNSWPLMSDKIPDWAVNRPKHSDPRYTLTKP